jgi:hypothetical protein
MYFKSEERKHISQGDIFADFIYVRWAEQKGGDIDLDDIKIPFFVVLTQSCDLEQDFKDRQKNSDEKRDKYIQSILVCPAYNAEKLRIGEHLKSEGLVMQQFTAEQWSVLKKNRNFRYHFLPRNDSMGIPELVIDFKQYYTIPTHILYKITAKYVCSFEPLFREDVSQRFSYYLSRIGLPESKEKGVDE